MSNKSFKKRLYKVIVLLKSILLLYCKITNFNQFLHVHVGDEKKLAIANTSKTWLFNSQQESGIQQVHI